MTFLVCILLVPHVQAQSMTDSSSPPPPTWSVRPNDTIQIIGGNITLECLILNLGNRVMTWSKIEGTLKTLLFINSVVFNAPSRYYAVIQMDRGLNLVLSSLQANDSAQYECEVQQSTLKATATVTVLAPPGVPVIVLNSSADSLYEGQSVTLNCSSFGGNPSPNITWSRNGILLPMTSYYLLQAAQAFGTASSILPWKFTRSDFLANFTCRAQNNVIPEQTITQTVRYYVRYGPRVSLGNFNPLVLVENSSTSLNCSIDSYPVIDPQSIQWYKDGHYLANGATVGFNFVSILDAGNYSCSATNFVNGEGYVIVDVQYAPRLTALGRILNGQFLVPDGSMANISFSVDSNPPPSSSDSSSYKWFKNGVRITGGQGPSFLMENVQRNESGSIYICQVTNFFHPSVGDSSSGVGMGTIKLTVLYRPGQARVIIEGNNIIPSVGDNVTIDCRLDDYGEPMANIKWSKDGVDLNSDGSRLELNSVTLTDIGNYTCIPSNAMGFGQTDTKFLDIYEPPSWIDLTLPDQAVLTDNVTNGFHVSCSVYGHPPPSIDWYKDGLNVNSLSGLFSVTTTTEILDSLIWNVTSTLHFNGPLRLRLRSANMNFVEKDDAGNYVCLATSPFSNATISQQMQLAVLYIPIMKAIKTKVAVDINQTAVLFCHCQSLPPPNFIWFHNNTQLTPNNSDDKYIMVTWMNSSSIYPYGAALNISNVDSGDIGFYSCLATNEVGFNETIINLTVKTQPDAPRDLVINSLSWESVQLAWQPGFNGGYEQEFFIEYNSSFCFSSSSLSSLDNVTLMTISVGSIYSYNVTDLCPNTTYSFMVQGKNRLGLGDFSNAVTTITKAFTVAPLVGVVRFYIKSHILIFQPLPGSEFCLRIQLMKGGLWQDYIPDCQSMDQGSITLAEDQVTSVKVVQVEVCLLRRHDICSSPQNAMFDMSSDVSVDTIIIVACVCGGLVVILSIVLFILCCSRSRSNKKKCETLSSLPSAAVARPPIAIQSENNIIRNGRCRENGARRVSSSGAFDNPALDARDGKNESYNLIQDGRPIKQDILNNYGAKTGDVFVLSVYPYHFDKKTNSNSSDSGVSTPETPKPRRVIYEVIV